MELITFFIWKILQELCGINLFIQNLNSVYSKSSVLRKSKYTNYLTEPTRPQTKLQPHISELAEI